MISQRIILLSVVCLVLLVGILVWVARDHEDSLESGEQPIAQPDELATAVTEDAGDSDANTVDTTPNVISAETPRELPEQAVESLVDSEPVADQTVSEDIVADQTSDNVPEVAPGTVADDPNVVARLRESILAGPYGKKPVIEVLQDLVEENSPFQSREQILAIVLRKQEALPVLKEALLTGSDATKWTVLSLLQKNLQWQEMSDEVLASLNDSSLPDKVLARAIAASVALDIIAAGETIQAILAENENDDVREVAIRAIGELNHGDAKNDLTNALTEPSTRIALAAAESLGKMGDPSGFSIVAKHMDHSDWFMRKLAAQALGHIGTDAALNALEIHLGSEESPMAKAEIEISINRISMKRESRAEQLSHLSELLDSENRFVLRWAHEHILKEFPNECIPIFRERSQTAPEKLKRVSEMYLLLAEEHEKGGAR